MQPLCHGNAVKFVVASDLMDAKEGEWPDVAIQRAGISSRYEFERSRGARERNSQNYLGSYVSHRPYWAVNKDQRLE